MNYVVNYVRVKSNWFDNVGKNKMNQYEKIDGYKGLYLYLQLYRFKIYNQKNEDTFLTSISMLRKETGYSTQEIFELLKKMKTAKVIKLLNVSRWDYLLDEKGEIRDKDILQIIATDLPNTERKQKTDKSGNLLFEDREKTKPKMVDSPVTQEDFFIPINIEIFELYKGAKMYGTGAKGSSIEKYVALYCLINKWNNNIEGKMNMRIEKIANILGFDKDYIHKMIYSMNRNYFLQSTRRSRKSGSGFYFEHYICWKEKNFEQFKEHVKEKCDKLVARYDKRIAKSAKNAKVDIENEMEVNGEIDDTKEVKKDKGGFGNYKERIEILDKVKKQSSDWGDKNDGFTDDELYELMG